MKFTNKCENCSSETVYKEIGRTKGFYCSNCDWNIVTSNMPNMVSDKTIYQIRLVSCNPKNVDQIKALAKVSGLNYLDARRLMLMEKPLIQKGLALEVKDSIFLLKKAGIIMETMPEWPY